MRFRFVTAVIVMAAFAVLANGQAQSRQLGLRPMLDRLAAEASAYEKLALEVTGEETLHQREINPRKKLKPRVGEAAERPVDPAWIEREIISYYGLSSVGRSLHEIREVVLVDGRNVQGQDKAQQTLRMLLTTSGEQQKLAALKQIQKYTLGGAVTDFAPLILFFAHGGAERFEFSPQGIRQLGTVSANAYHFKQIDGSAGLTLFTGQTQKLPIEGELWISEDPAGPIRITLSSTVPDSDPLIREEATVDYTRSPFGALLPVKVEHVEYHGDEVTSEHLFDYDNFQKLANH